MKTIVLRHGQTEYSKQYLVNGDPTKRILLTEDGRRSLRRIRDHLLSQPIRAWLTSEFPRARQTAALLMNAESSESVVDPRLNEIDYGVFEGGPFLEYASWLELHGSRTRPPNAAESQHEAIRRLLTGLLAARQRPGPRVLVGHGLLVSVLRWNGSRSVGEPMPLFFTEAPHAEPLAIADDELPLVIATLMNDLEPAAPIETAAGSGASTLRLDGRTVVATVDALSPAHTPDKKDIPHA